MESPPAIPFIWESGTPQTDDLDEFVAHLATGKEQAIFDEHYGNYGPKPGVQYHDPLPAEPVLVEWMDLEEDEP